MEAGLPAEVLAALRGARVVGVLRAASADAAVAAAQAAARAGLRAVEVTFTTPDAAAAIRTLRATLPANVLLGAGTVMTPEDAGAAAEAGAAFLVSPHLCGELIAFAASRGVLYLPGVLTPTEVVLALRLGAHAVKLFPAASSGGPAYLRDLLGPFPGLPVMVTGGVQPPQVPAYLAAGALAAGLGSPLFPGDALAAGDTAAVVRAVGAALVQAGEQA